MRPHKFEDKWIDLDHVLTIEPSDQYYQVGIEFAFRDEKVWLNYLDDAELVALLKAWRGDRACLHEEGFKVCGLPKGHDGAHFV
jgi:hypothetical protein